MPDCVLKVFDGSGLLAREVPLTTPPHLDQTTLDSVHRECISGVTCSHAILEQGFAVHAVFLHPQLVPPEAIVTSVRKRSVGRWLTHTLDLDLAAGGRAIIGPEVFFRQVDLGRERAWMAPLILRMLQKAPSRNIPIADQALWSWEVRGNRFFYRDDGKTWQLFGAGNTPLLRMEQAIHLADPQTTDEYLWAVGAISLGAP
ncbi:MAG: hypothetical protein ACI9MC_000022 [Kiritimatiellia bacterium]